MVTPGRFKMQRSTFACVLLISLGIVPTVLMAHHVRANWVPLPYWDEWHTPGSQFYSWCEGKLTLPELFSQHNESRKFFPRLLYFALASVGGWDVRKEMTVLFLEVCLLGALLWRLLRRTQGASAVSASLAWMVMVFLCFAPVQFENFLWGIQLESFFPGVATIAIANVNLSALSFRAKTLLNLSLALVATYTCANGMLLWLLGFPFPNALDETPRGKKLFWYGIYVLSAAIAIGCYFIGYHKPGYHPGWASIGQWRDLTHYLVFWAGAYFSSNYVDPFVFGIIAWALFLVIIASATIVLVCGGQWRTFYPWLLIGAYALVTAVVTAFGRLGFGVHQALEGRYAVFSLFFYLASVGAIFALYCACLRDAKREKRAVFLSQLALFLGLVALCWIASYEKNLPTLRLHRENRRELARTLKWMDAIPDNPDLALIVPQVEALKLYAHTLAAHRILRLPFVRGSLAARVQQTPPAANEVNGRIESAVFGANRSLVVSGWAWLPVKNKRADCVVIGWKNAAGMFKPATVMGTGVPRADLREQFHVPNMYRAGFSKAINPANFPKGDVSIAGWAIDFKEEAAFPLAASDSVRVFVP